MKQSIKSSLLHVLAAAILVAMPMHQVQSAPGTLPTSPLYLSTIVEPNVFLTFDDSRSMQTETLVSMDTSEVRGTQFVVNTESLPFITISGGEVGLVFLHPDLNITNVVPPVSALAEAWVFKSSQANKLYYDPAVDYDPWPGKDAFGNALYVEHLANKAPIDPNSTAVAADFTDLTALYSYVEMGLPSHTVYLPTYYKWDPGVNDLNNNGVIDADTDTYTEVVIPSSPLNSVELQNFSNWFTYYRTRESSMKAAMGKIINNTDSNRMGLRLFNGGHQSDITTMTDPTNKLAMLRALYNTSTLGVGNLLSPARTALEATGQMFAGDLAPGIPSPIVAAADGGTCQQNFNILMTDGYWNGDDPGGWGTNAPSDSLNADGDNDSNFDGGNYADSYLNTLADVAMHFYETDLDSLLLDEVPQRTGVDLATHQHLVNYTLSFGLKGTLDPTDPAQHPTSATFPGWPEPVGGTFDGAGFTKGNVVGFGSATTIDDLWHAAYNSRGEYLTVGGSSTELEGKLSRSIADISERTGTAAAVAVNSARLSTNSAIYLAQFNTNRWQGNLRSIKINTDTGALLDENWEASGLLTARVEVTKKPRQIITYDNIGRTGLPFQWLSLTTDMKNDLLTNPLGSLDIDTTLGGPGAARLEYIRGDRSNDSLFGFRERLSLLGDLVNSGPVFVGPPNLAWPDGGLFPPAGPEGYSTFKKNNESRQSLIYIGANDGMLHAFNDADGEEVFAYVPGMLYSDSIANEGLHYLSDPNYIHKYYVDLTPTISDIYINTNWKTVLVGGLRGGGRGLFALDITNPGGLNETNAATIPMWEFTSAQDSGLGYTFARPTIGLSNKPNTWVAIFGNGYNSDTGEASLFIVDIQAGLDGWTAGDWTKIVAGVPDAGAKNGLAAPALADLDGNGTIDRAYAGDLRGNMWVFDLSGKSKANWTSAGAKLLFTAPANQQITAKPVLAKHPTQADSKANFPNIMVYFGTGQYLVNGDKITKDMQSFYGVWDDNAAGVKDRTTLVEQTFDTTFTAGRVLTRNPIDYKFDDGWFFNLNDPGERATTSPIARADTVFFNTFVPSAQACDLGGYGYRFAVDMATGGSPLKPVIDSNNDGVVDDNDYQNNGSFDSTLAAVRQEGFLPEPVFIEDLAFTGEVGAKIKSLGTVPTGRFSWQELIF